MSLVGKITRVTFKDGRTGFCILVVQVTDGDHQQVVTCKGTYFNPVVGMQVELIGDWHYDPKWGKQFKFSFCQETDAVENIPHQLTGICSWLNFHTAFKIYQAHKDRTFEVIKTNPELLKDLLNDQQLSLLQQAVFEMDSIKDTYSFLHELGIPANTIKRVVS